ncbi:DUF2635 domain-containing protein [Pseudomonas pseudonitroreducens]|uniref:DUF2635 domain-containing protein n=1 Tax=Pseudomonas pseudonitroreducens TaxID=2892326 RepID=UPI001F1D0559|nr:DUF2635 domain-containing protein [Pseudomonas pseudonitroreducens]
MRVIAAPGLRVPHEGKARTFIEAAPAKSVDVPDTTYYRRRVAAGELLLAEESDSSSAAEAEPSAEVDESTAQPSAKRRAKASS